MINLNPLLMLVAPTFDMKILQKKYNYNDVKAERLPIPVPIDEAPVSPIFFFKFNNSYLYHKSIYNILFENNVVTNGETLINIGSAENITVRNNLFITNFSGDGSDAPIIIGSKHGFDQRSSKNVFFVPSSSFLEMSLCRLCHIGGLFSASPFPANQHYSS